MSDRQSKNYEEARKAFCSSVSRRTRAQTDAYIETIAQTEGISGPSRNLTLERKRRREMQSPPKRQYIDVDEPEIERIDDSEFLSKRKCSTSMIRGSTRPGVDKGFHAANSWKNVNIPCQKPCATVEISHEFVGGPRFLVQQGNDNEDTDTADFERIDKAEFIGQVSLSMIGSSNKEKVTESFSAATSRKAYRNVGKRESSVGYCESFCPKEAFRGSDHPWPHESSSLVLIESDSDETILEVNEIRRSNQARKTNIDSKSKIGQSADKGHCAARLRKNFGGPKRYVPSYNPITPRYYSTGSEMLASNDEWKSFKEIKTKGNDKGLLRKGKLPLIREGYNAVSSTKRILSENYCGLSSKNASRDSHKEQASRSSSYAEKVNSDDDTDHEELEIEQIDESEFRNVRSKFVSESMSSTRQERDEEQTTAISTKNVGRVTEKIASKKTQVDHSTRKKNVDDSKFVCSSSSNKSKSDVGVGIRTRSRVGSVKKPTEVSLAPSTDLDSSSTDSEDDSLDADFKVESSDNDVELSGSHEENEEEGTNEGAKTKTKDVVDEVNVRSGPKEAAPFSHLNNSCHHSGDGSKERTEATSSHLHVRAKTKSKHVVNKVKFPTGPKVAAPSFHSKDRYAHTGDGTNERTEETNSHFHIRDEIMTEDMYNENVPMGPKETAPPCHSKDFYDHTVDGTNERTGATSSGSRDRAKTRTADMAFEKKVPTRTKEAPPPFQSEDVYDHIEERTGATSSGFHVQPEDVVNEMEEPTRRKQVSSRPVKDLCSVLADAVLGRGQTPEIKEIYEEAEQVIAFRTQGLPQKFRFEDEVPEQAEKTEYEKEIDSLFDDLDRDWALDELQSFDYHEDNLEKENSPAEETQHARCSRGKHELVLEDDKGLICIFCHHVEIAPKDVMPEWGERPYRDSGRKRNREMEEPLNYDELHAHHSTDDDDAHNSIDATGTVWSLKPGVRESMYEHQQEGFEFLWRNLAGSINIDELKSNDPLKVGGCIISHAPGTGKTRLTIVFIETYIRMFPKCRPVIITPASTLPTWEEEFRKWNVKFPFHNLCNAELSGKENMTALRLLPRTKIRDMDYVRMMKICSWDMGGSILGISYSLFEKLTGDKDMKQKRNKKREAGVSYHEKVKKILMEKPGLVVLDEGHTPRNQRSNIWNVLRKLQTEKRVILSGTPFQNNFVELFNTISIVRPAMANMLAQEKTFSEMLAPRRKSSSRNYKGETLQSPVVSDDVDRLVENLKSCMSPFVHLHKGTILQKCLPGLRDCVILLKPPELQKSLIDKLGGASNFKHEHEVAMISVHPYLFLQFETPEDRKIGIDMDKVAASKLNFQEGVKTRFLLELVRLSLAVKEKVLVFSQYIDPLVLIKDQLKEVFKWVEGREILHIQGRQYTKQRQSLINQFNDPQSESKIMLASTKCCSEGISLVGASRVVLLDVVWNPSVERQAICRAYRIGQKKFVHTYHLMTSGTSEADKYCRQAEKERISELVFSSAKTSDQQKLPSLGEDRILEVMVANESLKGMFEKIINQPKGTDLIQTFGL